MLVCFVLDCLTTLLNVFASTFDSVASGKAHSGAGQEQHRKQWHEYSSDHDESPLVQDGLRVGTQNTDAAISLTVAHGAPIRQAVLCASEQNAIATSLGPNHSPCSLCASEQKFS